MFTNCYCCLILYTARARVPSSISLGYLHKHLVARRDWGPPSRLTKLWMSNECCGWLLFEPKLKKDDLKRLHLSYTFFEGFCCCHSKISCSEPQSTELSRERKLGKNITNANKHFRWYSEVYWVAWNFLWNTLYVQTDSSMFKSHWRPSFFFGTGKFKIVKLVEYIAGSLFPFPAI